MAGCHTLLLSRKPAAGHKAPCSTCARGPRLRPSPVLQPTRSVQVSAAPEGGSWYEQSPPRSSSSGNSDSSGGRSSSSSGSGSGDKQQQRQRSRHYYDTAPRHAKQKGESAQDRRSRYDRERDEDQEGDDGPGWWEVPREVRDARQQQQAAATAAGVQLLPWQEEKLLLAAAGSKKKMQVQVLAVDLGLDRSEVLAWVAAFRAKPKQEQARLLAPLQPQLQQQQQQQQQQQHHLQQQQQQKQQESAGPFWAAGSSSNGKAAAAAAASSALPFSAPNPNTGYVPFAARRGAAAAAAGGVKGPRRLPAEVLRTLEGVYRRSPWPSKDVVAGLFDLHRLPRDTVLDWFTARRDMDGLPHNPRQAKLAARSNAAAAAAAAPQADPQWQQQQQQQQQQLRSGAVPAGSTSAPAAVSRLTARELASLRSALPSPTKFKGAKLAEELGIKAGHGPGLEISGITFVARDGAAAWRGAWRRRRAAKGLPAQQLDFQRWFV